MIKALRNYFLQRKLIKAAKKAAVQRRANRSTVSKRRDDDTTDFITSTLTGASGIETNHGRGVYDHSVFSSSSHSHSSSHDCGSSSSSSDYGCSSDSSSSGGSCD